METTISPEAEEYIEVIYRFQKKYGMAKTKELSEALHVVPGSITNTIEHLESHGLVTHLPYRGVKLTIAGEKIAIDMLRRHRLAERLLTDLLRAEWSSVHEEACKLEHALTKNVASLLEERLGYPKFCPHGNPIPTENGTLMEEICVQLTDVALNEDYVVVRITDENRENLTVLAEAGIKPETHVLLTEKSPNQIRLCVNKIECSLERVLAENVFVKTNVRNHNVV